MYFKETILGASLTVQWLRLHTSTAGGTGSIPGWGMKIPHAAQPKKKRKKKIFQNKMQTLVKFRKHKHSKYFLPAGGSFEQSPRALEPSFPFL